MMMCISGLWFFIFRIKPVVCFRVSCKLFPGHTPVFPWTPLYQKARVLRNVVLIKIVFYPA